MAQKLCQIMISREKRILNLSRRFFSGDLLVLRPLIERVYRRKSRGMLLQERFCSRIHILNGRNIWNLMIPSLSFGCLLHLHCGKWLVKLRMARRPQKVFRVLNQLRSRCSGTFPAEIKEKFADHRIFRAIANYHSFEQSAGRCYGNAFAGKYESISASIRVLQKSGSSNLKMCTPGLRQHLNETPSPTAGKGD